MEKIFKIINLDNKQKIGNLTAEAHSKVKSQKFFPVYMIDNKKMIFKPLSKTKPLTTPFFAYSEVYWSYVIKKYFDPKAPRYYLAISKGIEEEQPKYFKHGVLVESITPNDEKLINLYDYFIEHPDPSVNIKDYTNYCMKNYDYSEILSSDFIKTNKEIGEDLAQQILLSILRQDQNFHYENINFISNGKSEEIAPPIDFEFSTPFLYPDKQEDYQYEQERYKKGLTIKYEEDNMTALLKQFAKDVFPVNSHLKKNICLIIKSYPDIVLDFIKKLELLIADLPNIIISDPDNYIGPLNSDYWKVGHALYKKNNLVEYEELKTKIKLKSINKDAIFNRISADILRFSKWLNLILKTYLISWYIGIEDLENLTTKELLAKLGVDVNVKIEDIDIYKAQMKIKKL